MRGKPIYSSAHNGKGPGPALSPRLCVPAVPGAEWTGPASCPSLSGQSTLLLPASAGPRPGAALMVLGNECTGGQATRAKPGELCQRLPAGSSMAVCDPSLVCQLTSVVLVHGV